MKRALGLFSSLFENIPCLNILHINNEVDFLNTLIEDVIKKNEGKLFFKDLRDFKDKKDLRLRLSPREFKYIILGDILNTLDNKEPLLKMYYQALENSGNIIILSKKSNNELPEIKELLDKSFFQAINDIDIFDEYIIITAKKLHMWGNGL